MSPLTASRIRQWLDIAAVNYARKDVASGMASKVKEATNEEVSKLTPEEQADGSVAFVWMLAADSLSEDTIIKIQNYALRCCSVYDDQVSVFIPLLMPSGQWTGQALYLEQDALTVGDLITKALQFNLSPFFLRGLTQSTPATNQV